MPFKSEKQRRLCWYLHNRGLAPNWDCAKWEAETNDKTLPTQVSRQRPVKRKSRKSRKSKRPTSRKTKN